MGATVMAVMLWPVAIPPPSPWWSRSEFLAVVLVLAAALLVVAGVLRLARWWLLGEPHNALVGTALVVLGAVCLPWRAITRVGVHPLSGSILLQLTLAGACLVVIGLVARALRTERLGAHSRPRRLLPRLLVGWSLVLGLETVVVHRTSGWGWPDDRVFAVPASVALAWVALAVRTWLCDEHTEWARRSAPLFLALGAAELLAALDDGAPGSLTTVALLLGLAVAVLATRSAHLDLGAAVAEDRRRHQQLVAAFATANGRAGELTRWREHLVHDAVNAVAGLRAALTVLDEYDGGPVAAQAARLRRAAAREVGHLEHLLLRTADEPLHVFEADTVVRDVAECSQALGRQLVLDLPAARAVGRPGDLVIVLKNLLANVDRHAPGSTVRLAVRQEDRLVQVVVADDGPGLDPALAERAFERGHRGARSTGSGLGLFEARQLMLAQGGDIVLRSTHGRGATFVVTLPAPLRDRPRAAPGTLPTQRGGTDEPPTHIEHGLVHR